MPWALKVLIRKKAVLDRLTVTVVVIDDIHDNDGELTWLVRPNEIPYQYTVTINPAELTFFEFISTVCHELVHVAQIVLRTRKEYWADDDNIKWMDKKLSVDMEYWKRPWEIEARGLEHRLATEFINRHPHMTKQQKFTQAANIHCNGHYLFTTEVDESDQLIWMAPIKADFSGAKNLHFTAENPPRYAGAV